MKLHAFILICLFIITASAGNVLIRHEKDNCKDGRANMNIQVLVDNDKVQFSPACAYSLNRNFKTRSGVLCQISSSMCSSSSSTARIEVSCNNGARDYKSFECKKAKPKTERGR